MKTKSKKINLPLIIIFCVLATAFLVYGVYMVLHSISYVNAYQGSSTVAVENSLQYIVSSSINYFGFSLLLYAAAAILGSFNRIPTARRFEDIDDTADDNDNYDEFDEQRSMADFIGDTEYANKKIPQPTPEQKANWEAEYLPISEQNLEAIFGADSAIEPEASEDNFFEKLAEMPETESEAEEAPSDEAADEPEPTAETEPITEPKVDAEPEAADVSEPAVESKPVITSEPVVDEPEASSETTSDSENTSDNEILVERVKIEKRQTPVKRDDLSNTIIKDIFEKK